MKILNILSVLFELPSSVTTIGNEAFYWNKSLRTITLPTSLERIGHGAFCSCFSIQYIKLPTSLKRIEGSAFMCCTSLLSIEIPPFATHIEYRTFPYCASLISVHLPSAITTVEYNAFHKYQLLINIVLPRNANVHEHYDEAFIVCPKLKAVVANTNYNRTNITTWLNHRFNNLPLHQLCYDPVITSTMQLNLTIQTITNNKGDTLLPTDRMGMNSLHILVCNPAASAHLIEMLMTLEPSMSTMETIHRMTPIDLFLKL